MKGKDKLLFSQRKGEKTENRKHDPSLHRSSNPNVLLEKGTIDMFGREGSADISGSK